MNIFDFGFVIPLLAEAKPLLQQITHRKRHKSASWEMYTGILFDKKISLIISGSGKIKSAAATQFLIDAFPAKQYIHYGTAGAISSKLNIGDIVVATRVIEHDVIELFPHKIPPPHHKITPPNLKNIMLNNDFSLVWGTILSGNEDVISTKRKHQLHRLHKGLSVDWESAGFALTCELNGVVGYIFRGISDNAYEHTASEYGKNQNLVVTNIMHLLKGFFTV
ncbi:hypothetical protein A3A79_02545 [Candidatus Gottesmanbacteria bacterium RIFCSPLOWO2_01_FULL_43_11b]|uniref:Nucleoside phosphorylase domain-containing protein n=1 Tax=Candidatus Gottesmanbacteria bacterium RIFCSPLOWO2_01_FULL_43_11b TaxID=1798392 RepID=A0A1F6AH94_9BACT|nr:MAG: hypothetical protein A3A79_02545 [Candidatus Gottesmanbacteria bacterium RIFCSPLOWO2_01_FULL_43_11b]